MHVVVVPQLVREELHQLVSTRTCVVSNVRQVSLYGVALWYDTLLGGSQLGNRYQNSICCLDVPHMHGKRGSGES